MTPEEIERHVRECEKVFMKDRLLAMKIGGAIATADLHQVLRDLIVVCGGREHRCVEVKFVDKDGNAWWPIFEGHEVTLAAPDGSPGPSGGPAFPKAGWDEDEQRRKDSADLDRYIASSSRKSNE